MPIRGTNGADVLQLDSRATDQRVYAYGGDDIIVGANGAGWAIPGVTIDGGAGNDRIWAQQSTILDLSGNNEVASYGQSVIQTGSGRDTVSTSGGDAVATGGGNDSIVSSGLDTIDGGAGFDTVLLAVDNPPADVESSLMALGFGTVGDAGDATLSGRLGPTLLAGVERIDLLLGNLSPLVVNPSVRLGSAAADRITVKDIAAFGAGGNDQLDARTAQTGVLLDGGTGRDTLWGGAGDDTLVGHGDGDRLVGGAGWDIASYRTVLLQDAGLALAENGVATVGADRLSQIEEIDFVDAVVKIGGRGGDTISGGTQVWGFGGNDSLSAGDGPARLDGGVGADTLAGGAAADTLLGGDGNDRLLAGFGDVVDGGAGVDEVVLAFNSGGWSDGSWWPLSQLRPMVADDGSVTLRDQSGVQLLALAAVERLRLDDVYTGLSTTVQFGTGNADRLAVATDAAFGAAGNDVLDARSRLGKVSLDGGSGRDRLIGGAGNDWFDEQADGDTVSGGAGWDVTRYAGRTLDSVWLQVAQGGRAWVSGDADTDALDGIEELRFADATVMIGSAGADTQLGADMACGFDGDDSLEGSAGASTLDGGAGNDTLVAHGDGSVLSGGAGDDRLVVAGRTDRIDGGAGYDTLDITALTTPWYYPWANLSGLAFSYASSAVTVAIRNTGVRLVLTGVEALAASGWPYIFDSVQIGTLRTGFGRPLVDGLLQGGIAPENAAAGLIVGWAQGVTDQGPGIRASLVNSAGGRFAMGDRGELMVAKGAVLDYEAATSYGVTIRFTDDVGRSTDKTFSVRITNVMGQTVSGGGSADSLMGTGEEDWLSGLAGADTLEGGSGADTLTGGAGADAFVFHAGGGRDVITDFSATGPEYDVLVFSSDVLANWAQVVARTRQSGSDLVIASGLQDCIVLKNVALASFTRDNVAFA